MTTTSPGENGSVSVGIGREVFPDPRFYLYRDRPDLRERPGALEAEIPCAIRTREEVVAKRRQLERLPVRERIDRFVKWCDRLGPPYASRAQRLVAELAREASR